MANIPSFIRTRFDYELSVSKIHPSDRKEYRKWLGEYLAFCREYNLNPTQPDNLSPFVRRLWQKVHSKALQDHAIRAVSIYYRSCGSSSLPLRKNVGKEKIAEKWKQVFASLEGSVKEKGYSRKTLQAYSHWTARLMHHAKKGPSRLIVRDACAFMEFLALKQMVSPSAQNQAFNAILFLFRNVLNKDVEGIEKAARRKYRRNTPQALPRSKIKGIAGRMPHPFNLLTMMLYGCGLRLSEGVNLRLADFDDKLRFVTIRKPKGETMRSVPLPRKILPQLKTHFEKLKKLHKLDLEAGFAGAMKTVSNLNGKETEFESQWVFPSPGFSKDPQTNEIFRSHLHETGFQKAFKQAVKLEKIKDNVSANTLRHSFAIHLLESGFDIHAVKELLGHNNVRTTAIYARAVKTRPSRASISPLDLD